MHFPFQKISFSGMERESISFFAMGMQPMPGWVMKIINFMKQSEKLIKLQFLLKNSKISKTTPSSIRPVTKETIQNQSRVPFENSPFLIRNHLSLDLSNSFSQNLAITAKPLNLLFSIDQFLFEFSKKTYQQKKKGEFSQQLKERKKLSLFYGHLTRKQILNLFNKVKKKKGYFSKNVFSLLERRLDIVLYRSGITKTIAEARQLIKHKKIQVNQNFVNHSSFLLDSGDVISLVPETCKIVVSRLLKSFHNRSTKNPPKIIGDFVLKLEKNLTKSDTLCNLVKNQDKSSHELTFHEKRPYTKTKTLSGISQKIQSKFLCYLLTQLLCARMKLRCFYNFKNLKQLGFQNPVIRSQESLSQILQFYVNFNVGSLNSSTKDFLLGEKKTRGIQVKSKRYWKNSLSSRKECIYKLKTHQQQRFFLDAGVAFAKNFMTFPEKKALVTKKSMISFFWSRNCISLKNRKNPNLKSQKKLKLQQKGVDLILENQSGKSQRFFKTSSLERRKNFYRKSFLFFFKNLENYNKFSNYVYLNSKKFLFKKSFYKKNVFSNKNFNLKSIKPLHIEISYTLLNVIYLYSPQRINFPFFINLDLIQRSLN